MSHEWRQMTFAEAVEVNPRRAVSAGTTVPYVEMAAVPSAGASIEYLLERQIGGGAKFKNGDTLFARITPCAENGKTAFVDCLRKNEVGLGSTELIVFGPRDGLTDPAYVYHLARSEIVRGPAISQMVGTTGRARVPNNVFDEIEVALPPLHEQRRIAEILSSVDEAIAATRAVIEQTKTVKQAVLERLLTRGIGHTRFKQTEIGEIPEGWEVAQVGQFATLQPGYAFKSAEFADSGVRLLRGSNVGVGSFDWSESVTKYFPEDRLEEFSEYVLGEDDIIVAMDRPFISTGFKAARLKRQDLPCLLLQRVGRLRPLVDCEPDWLWQIISAGTVRTHLERQQVGTDLPHISRSDVESCTVALPPLAEQKAIAATLLPFDIQLDLLMQSLSAKLQLKAALMSDLLTGRKRVTDALPLAAE